MPYDPFTPLDPFGQPPPVRAAQQPDPRLRPLSPDEEASTLGGIGMGALHGLGYLGSTLNKTFGGRAIRGGLGMLAGKNTPMSELFSFLPFSDTLGLTDPTNEVRGSDLLGGSKDQAFLSPEGIGGLGIDILTDPLTYLTLGAGATTNLGKAAAKIGVLPKTAAGRLAGLAATSPEAEALARAVSGVSHGPLPQSAINAVAGQRLAGHVGFGIPFSGTNAITADLSAPLAAAQNFASQLPGASWIGGKFNQFRHGTNALFEPAVRGQTMPELAEAARTATEQAGKRLPKELEEFAKLPQWVQEQAGWTQGAKMDAVMESRAAQIGTDLRAAVERIPSGATGIGQGIGWDAKAARLAADFPQLAGQAPAGGWTWQALEQQAPQLTQRYTARLQAIHPDIVSKALELRQTADRLLAESQAAGFGTQRVGGMAEFAPRQGSIAEVAEGAGGAAGGVKPRQAPGREFRLFADDINDIARNQAYAKNAPTPMTPAQIAEDIRRNYYHWDDQFYNQLASRQSMMLNQAESRQLNDLLAKQAAGIALTSPESQQLVHLGTRHAAGAITPAELAQLERLSAIKKEADTLAGWTRSFSPEARDTMDRMGGYFANHPVADMQQYISKHVGRVSDAQGAYQGLASLSQQTGGTIPVSNVLPKLGLTAEALSAPERAIVAELTPRSRLTDLLSRQATLTPAELRELAKLNHLAPASQAEILSLANLQAKAAAGSTAEQNLAAAISRQTGQPVSMATLGGYKISPANEQALVNLIRPVEAPSGAAPWLSAIDSITNATKAGSTAWPQTVARNFWSDIFARVIHGGDPYVSGARALREGQVVPGLGQRVARFAGMSDEAATQALMREVYAHGVIDPRMYQAVEATGDPVLKNVQKFLPQVGTPGQELGTTLRNAFTPSLESANPLNIRGVMGNAESKFAPVAAAQGTQNYLEEVNRLATYLSASERGYNPAAAMAEVLKAHHDFGNLTGFEKSFMRRLVPFYSWNRQNLPVMINEMATNPGGRLGTAMRATNAAAGRSPGFVPEQVSQTGTQIPVGQEENGRQTYVGSLGMPYEDLTNLGSMSQLMGMTNPLVRVPYELATGNQTFTGRDLSSNYPYAGPGAGTTVNTLLTNSPLSRVGSYANAWMDPNRSAAENLVQQLLGPRITTIDVQRARDQAIRNEAERVIRNAPEHRSFDRLYVPNDRLGGLSPEELNFYRLYRQNQRRPS